MRTQGDHYQVSENVYNNLPEWQRAEWNEVRDRFIGPFSSYVDHLSPVVTPSVCEALEPDYRKLLYLDDGRFCQVALRCKAERFAPLVRYSGDLGGDSVIERDAFFDVFPQFFRRLVDALKARDHVTAAKLGGIVSHLICDRHPGDHIEPGIWSRLILPPSKGQIVPRLDCWWATGQEVNISEVRYRPRLLGNNVDESMHAFYQRYLWVMKNGLPYVSRILAASYQGRKDEVKRLLSEVRLLGIEILSDYLYTAFCLAYERVDAEEVEKLARLDLTTLFADVNEMDTLYFYGPYTDSSVDFFADGHLSPKRIPPEIWRKQGGTDGPRVEEIQPVLAVLPDSGCSLPERWAKLSYRIPAGSYRRFTCTAGLHSRLSTDRNGEHRGCVGLQVLGDEKELFSRPRLVGGDPAVEIDLDISGLKSLTLVVTGLHETTEEFWLGHFVWGRPMLHR